MAHGRPRGAAGVGRTNRRGDGVARQVQAVDGHLRGDMEVVTFEPDRLQVMKGDIGPMHPTLTYQLEPSNGGTRFTRRVQIQVSGWMKVFSPMMGMMLPKQNKGFLANLKWVLEQRPSSI